MVFVFCVGGGGNLMIGLEIECIRDDFHLKRSKNGYRDAIICSFAHKGIKSVLVSIKMSQLSKGFYVDKSI